MPNLKELKEEDRIILDLLFQSASVEEKKTVWRIYCAGLSSNEDAAYYLWKKGILKKINGQVFSYKKLLNTLKKDI